MSQTEISTNRFLEISSGKGLLASYHFNQGIPGGNNTGITTLTDATSNNYTGTIANFTLNGSTSNFVGSGPNFNPSKQLNLTMQIQGFYDAGANSMTGDTVKVYLRNSSSPYAAVDSAMGFLSSVGAGTFVFNNVAN